jgi:hypothetical protein
MEASKARVMLVDDHAMFRHGVEMLINREADMEVFAEASDSEEALAILNKAACHREKVIGVSSFTIFHGLVASPFPKLPHCKCWKL